MEYSIKEYDQPVSSHPEGDKRMTKECSSSTKKPLSCDETFTIEENGKCYEFNDDGKHHPKKSKCNCDPNHLVATTLVLTVFGMIFITFSVCLLTGQVTSLGGALGERLKLYADNESIEAFTVMQNKSNLVTPLQISAEEPMSNDAPANNGNGYGVQVQSKEEASHRNRIPTRFSTDETEKAEDYTKLNETLSTSLNKNNDSFIDRLRDFFHI